ncbi:MAG TPA: cyclic nucleotide-binding protein, partial [Alcanivorax sp.]|nr:cyclic nucleotide-binding protein [Alcanivorax sp.]
RNATVTMATDGVLMRLDRQDFDALLREPVIHTLDPADARQR